MSIYFCWARRIGDAPDDRYGINAYKPRLIGVSGINYDITNDLQLRRVLTQYQVTKFFTFEQLRKIAERRLLI